MWAMTDSRTSPRMRLVIVAAPAEAAERASVCAGGTGSGAKLAPYGFVDGLAVSVLARQLRHDRLHHLAHVLRRRRAGLGDRRSHGRIDFLRGRSRREVSLEDGQVAAFLG